MRKSPLQLTLAHRIPYDAQHLAIRNLKLVKNDTAPDLRRPGFQRRGNSQRRKERRRRNRRDQSGRKSNTSAGWPGQVAADAVAQQPAPALLPRKIRARFISSWILPAGKVTRLDKFEAPRSAPALGFFHFARRQNNCFRPRTQPLHDGPGQLQESPEKLPVTRALLKRSSPPTAKIITATSASCWTKNSKCSGAISAMIRTKPGPALLPSAFSGRRIPRNSAPLAPTSAKSAICGSSTRSRIRAHSGNIPLRYARRRKCAAIRSLRFRCCHQGARHY